MATDIAFALGILLLLGKRVPPSLKIFITALAIIDDLIAILVIAIFYTDAIQWIYLLDAFLVYGLLLILRYYRVFQLPIYICGGAIMWYFMLKSGIHATIAGVLLAFAIPFRPNKNLCPSHKLQECLHKPIAYGVLPIFALVNTAIVFHISPQEVFAPHMLGIFFGLLLGKPIGIFFASLLAVKVGWANLPKELTWRYILGA